MKRILVTIAALCVLVSARGNIVQGFLNEALGTNSFGDIEAMRGLTGNKNIVAGTYGYNMTTNAALLISYDRCWTSTDLEGANHADILRGGLTLDTTIAPFATWGITNVVCNVGVFSMAGTETGGSNHGSLVAVNGGYIDFEFHLYKSLYGHVGALYENRTESDYFGGNYAGVRGGIGCGW